MIFLVGVVAMPFFIYYGNETYNEKEELFLKNKIWQSIDQVDYILLDCMSCSENDNLTEENKVDFIIRYIIENKNNYISDIDVQNREDYYTYQDTVYYNFGKVTEKFIINMIDNFFNSFNYDMKNYKFYNNGNIELNFEPIEHLWYDNKKILNVEKINNKVYNVYMEYNREINGKFHTFNVKYIINYDNDIKFENIHIYNSIVSDENENKN